MTVTPVLTGAVARALATVDAVRFARHPVVLAGLAFGLVITVTTGHRVNGAFEQLLGYGLVLVAVGAAVAGHLLASRPWRARTAELWRTLPTPAQERTLGALLAVTGPVLVAVAYLLFAAVFVRAWEGVPVALAEGVVSLRPHPVELAQGILAVACLGAIGVALGTWLPSRAVPVLLLAGLLLIFTLVGWTAEGWLRWALPMTHHDQEGLGWVQAAPSWGYSITDGYDRVAMAWHDAYVAALTGLAASVALLRHRRGRLVVGATVVFSGLTAFLSVAQLP